MSSRHHDAGKPTTSVIRTVERSLGVKPGALPNLAGRWLDIDDESMRAGDRVVLIDPGEVTVTIPQQL